MLFKQVHTILLLLFPCIVSCNLVVRFDGSRAFVFSFNNYLEGDAKVLAANKTVIISATVVHDKDEQPSLPDLLELKIAKPNSPGSDSLQIAQNAHDFIIHTGEAINGVPKVIQGLGVCTGLQNEIPMQINEQQDYAVHVSVPRGQDLLAFLSGKPMDINMAKLAFTSLTHTIEDLGEIDMFHRNIIPENIYVQELGSGTGQFLFFLSNLESASYPGWTNSATPELIYSAWRTMVDGAISAATEKECLIYVILRLVSGYLPWENRIKEYLTLHSKQYTQAMAQQKSVDRNRKLTILEEIKILKCRFQFCDYPQYNKMDKDLKRILMSALMKEARGCYPTEKEIENSIELCAGGIETTRTLGRSESMASIVLNKILK